MKHRVIAVLLAAVAGALAWAGAAGEPQALFGVPVPVVTTDLRIVGVLIVAALLLLGIALRRSTVRRREAQVDRVRNSGDYRHAREKLGGLSDTRLQRVGPNLNTPASRQALRDETWVRRHRTT